MIVADEKEGGLGVVGDIPHDVAELRSDVHSTEGHEMVDVVDNDEFGFVLLDEGFDFAVDEVEILPLAAEDVEADEMEIFLFWGMGKQFMVDLGADVGIVEGVNPEHFAAWGYGLAARNTLTALSQHGGA